MRFAIVLREWIMVASVLVSPYIAIVMAQDAVVVNFAFDLLVDNNELIGKLF